jgi:hypothetical protein
MKKLSRTETFDVPPALVFNAIDDLGVTGSHMTSSSAMMMGSKLHLEYLTKNHTGPGTKYRWTGKMMGMRMDFTVEVTRWTHAKEKIWETIGETDMIIYSWYQMALHVMPLEEGTKAELSLTYEKPKGLINQIISFFFADLYCRWCLKKMLLDAKKMLVQDENRQRILSSN